MSEFEKVFNSVNELLPFPICAYCSHTYCGLCPYNEEVIFSD